MPNSFLAKKIQSGKSKRKTEVLGLNISEIRQDANNGWVCNASCDGVITAEKELQGACAFDCLILGIAFLRQSIRDLIAQDPTIKFFDEDEDGLFEVSVEDIFWTHDCIPEEMEIAYEWAKKNGFQK